MQTFVWDHNFVTGLPSIDEQHQRLVELINQLGEKLISGIEANEDALQQLFRQLADYARYHFGEEERLLEEAGIAPRHLDMHRASHRHFIEQVSTMWDARKSMTHPGEILHDFLTSWLGFHILGEDQTMARAVARIRRGEAAALAYETEAASKDHATAALLNAMRNLYHVLSEQNRDLAEANLLLEARVAERTWRLGQANEALSEANQRLERMARMDGLLEIANRRCFDERLEDEWRRAGREQKPLALLMIDVDYFKRYNDTYGHQAGDRCLQAVAGAARTGLRRPGDLLARYGGEELAILLPNTELDGARIVAGDVCAKVAELNIPHSASVAAPFVTVSVGIAAMRAERQTSPDQLVAAADRALYAAKEGGRNRVGAA